MRNGKVRDSYWSKPKDRAPIDQGEPEPAVYALHVLIGHHGIFSLTPIWLLSVGGMAWLSMALLGCLLAVAFRQPEKYKPVPVRIVAEGLPSVSPTVGREGHAQEMAREFAPSWMRRSFAMVCHLAVILGLIVVGRRHFHDATAGMAAATFYLLAPYTGIFVSQEHHVWPMMGE